MKPAVNWDAATVDSGTAFISLVRHVFSFDSNIRWLALEEAAREPRWAWRNLKTAASMKEPRVNPSSLVDPLWFMIADGRCDRSSPGSGQEHELLFAVLAYSDLVQVVARFGRESHVTVAAEPKADVHRLGMKLSAFLTGWAHSRTAA